MDTRSTLRVSVVTAIIAAVLAVFGAPAVARTDGIAQYPLPLGGDPHGIAAGPDGNLWYTDPNRNEIGRLTPAGTFTEFPLPDAYSKPEGIAAGLDGNMWFTETARIARITPTGAITEYPLPNGGFAYGIAAGPDGNMWFTWWNQVSENIGRITPDGTITAYPIPAPISNPIAITAGPDGNMWFTENGANQIGRITPAGVITEFPVPTPASGLWGIAAGADGNLWFVESYGKQIGRITPDGVITEYPIRAADSWPRAITAGPDGNLWFTDLPGTARITTAGTITSYPLPHVHSVPQGITSGPDGNLWITTHAITRLSPSSAPMIVKKTCPINVDLHKPTPKTVGNRILTDTITTNSATCALPRPVVLCRPLASTTAGEKAFCDTKITGRGQIRVTTRGYQAVRVTVLVRVEPKPGFTDMWKPDTWRRVWLLKEPAPAKGETDLRLSKRLVGAMESAGVAIKATRGATMSTSGVVTLRIVSVRGDLITHKGALVFSSSTGSVTLQDIALNYKTGKATALVLAPAVPTGIHITDLLTFTGGRNQITQNGTWRQVEVALATSTSLGNPAPLFAGQLGLPSGSIPSGMTIGTANVTLKR